MHRPEPMSGFGAPLRTATPMPVRPRSTRDPAAILPSLTKSSAISGGRTATSNASPASIRRLRPAAKSYSITIRWPLVRSKPGASSLKIARGAALLKTLISAVCAVPICCVSANTTTVAAVVTARIRFCIASFPIVLTLRTPPSIAILLETKLAMALLDVLPRRGGRISSIASRHFRRYHLARNLPDMSKMMKTVPLEHPTVPETRDVTAKSSIYESIMETRSSSDASLHRVLIVGGGAAGLELATRLGRRLGKTHKASITLVDRTRTHVWKPLLHEIASGSLNSETDSVEFIAHARRHHYRYRIGAVVGLDRSKRQVHVAASTDENGEQIIPPRVLGYDTLVFAVGSVCNDFGTPGIAQHAIALDTAEQAERFFQPNLSYGRPVSRLLSFSSGLMASKPIESIVSS